MGLFSWLFGKKKKKRKVKKQKNPFLTDKEWQELEEEDDEIEAMEIGNED